MVELTNEKKLEIMMKKLNKDQRSSLNNIRDAVEVIWRTDRVLPEFTDHGIEHSMRLIGHSFDILSSCEKKDSLTQIEIYLLLASIYLHDIGMQFCPSKESTFSGILNDASKIAAKKGLTFNIINFKSRSATNLTDDERDFIRDYHSLLTAAMITNSFTNTDTDYFQLYAAFRDFQINLREDLPDICRYHSKYRIMDCEEKLAVVIGRKRLIATILRLADELDIGYERIKNSNFEMLKRDPKNLIYWFKHKYTTVIFSNSVISLKINLHTEDSDKYGHIFQASVINNFCCKNRKLVEILNSYGYKIKLGEELERKRGVTQVLSDYGQDRIPEEVLHEFKNLELKDILKEKSISKCRYKYDIENFKQKIKKDILSKKSPYRVLILGDVILDTVMYMKRAPYDQVLIQDNLNDVYVLSSKVTSSERLSLGGAGGIMTALSQIPNFHVDMIGIIGNDSQGNDIEKTYKNLQEDTLKKGNICSFYPISIDGYPTITKCYYNCFEFDGQGKAGTKTYRFDREDRELIYKNLERYQETFEKVLASIEKVHDCIIIQDQGKGMVNEYVINWILQNYADKPIFIDPKYDFDIYKELPIKAIIPNIKEASMGIRKISNLSEDNVRERVYESRLLDKDYDSLKECLPNCNSFIIKSDTNGAVIFSKHNDFFDRDHIYPFPIDESKLKRSIGCGDTFDAYFIVGQLNGYSQQTSVKLANIAAGIKRKKELGEAVLPKEIYEELNTFSKTCIRGCQDE